MRNHRVLALATLALLNAFTLAAALVVARMLPPRLAALQIPRTADAPIVTAGQVLVPGQSGALPTRQGLAAAMQRYLRSPSLGGDPRIAISDVATGKLLYASAGGALATPASTTKVVTAVTALAVLGANATFSTRVVASGKNVTLVGGGDPTLAVNSYPAGDYPQPGTLAELASATARELTARGDHKVTLSYDTSLYSGAGLAPGWTQSVINTGNVTPISALEVDQGRLTASGSPEDSDNPVDFRPRSRTPAPMAAAAFARLLASDGISVSGGPASGQAPPGARELASVSSPPLSAMVSQMLLESNNVIAENLARHLALAMGRPATFAGAAAAVTAELRRLGIGTAISLVDGSGLSPKDGIAPVTLVQAVRLAAKSPDGALRSAVTGMPVAGFSGTLSAGGSVFGAPGGAARGVVRAKTGNLQTVATLAGLVQDRDGRLLAFAIMADQVRSPASLGKAANAIDRAVAGLAACGCG